MRKECGAITIITLTTILFMLAFLISTFVIVANRRQAQAEIKTETKKIYEDDVDNVDQVYQDYFASESEVVPIATVENLFKVGTNEYIVDGEKIYKCTPSANYKLVDTIEFAVNDYINEYSSFFETITDTVTETYTNEVTPYETANSTSNPYSTYTAKGTGTYKLEVWGAQGGTYSSTYATGGLGGYSVGTITLNEGDNLYVYVGGKGSYGTTSTYTSVTGGGYNGGGAAAYGGGTGGGATDIRFKSGTWNDSSSLLSRVIVAGGGGGAYSYSSTYKANGGYGGGTTGGVGSYSIPPSIKLVGFGGSQSTGGTAGTGSSTDYDGKAGTFGTGGNTGYKYNSTAYYSNGAGRRRLVWRRFCGKL